MELPGGNKTRKERGRRKKEGEKRGKKEIGEGEKKKKGNGDGSNEFCDRIREESA